MTDMPAKLLRQPFRRYDFQVLHRQSRTEKGITIFFMDRDNLRIGSRLDLETMSSGNMTKHNLPEQLVLEPRDSNVSLEVYIKCTGPRTKIRLQLVNLHIEQLSVLVRIMHLVQLSVLSL
jgi:hypothetical protein